MVIIAGLDRDIFFLFVAFSHVEPLTAFIMNNTTGLSKKKGRTLIRACRLVRFEHIWESLNLYNSFPLLLVTWFHPIEFYKAPHRRDG